MVSVMLAFNEGRQIEARIKYRDSEKWYDCVAPSWNWAAFDYRIKRKENNNKNTNTK